MQAEVKIRQPEEQVARRVAQEAQEALEALEVACFPKEAAGHFQEVAVVAVRRSCVLPRNSVGAHAPMAER